MKKGKLLNFGSKSKEEVIEKYPMLEHSAPRRLLARPMGEVTARKEGLKNAFPVKEENGNPVSNREGFHVKEQIGEVINQYWMPKDIFSPNHIRTDQYTIGEMIVAILQGQLFRRATWPMNKFLQFRGSVDLDNDLKEFVATKENPASAKMESFIYIATVHADPIKKDKFEVSIEPWVPSQDDLFSKDWQTFRIDISNLGSKKKK